jgi:hypothetical protein
MLTQSFSGSGNFSVLALLTVFYVLLDQLFISFFLKKSVLIHDLERLLNRWMKTIRLNYFHPAANLWHGCCCFAV